MASMIGSGQMSSSPERGLARLVVVIDEIGLTIWKSLKGKATVDTAALESNRARVTICTRWFGLGQSIEQAYGRHGVVDCWRRWYTYSTCTYTVRCPMPNLDLVCAARVHSTLVQRIRAKAKAMSSSNSSECTVTYTSTLLVMSSPCYLGDILLMARWFGCLRNCHIACAD